MSMHGFRHGEPTRHPADRRDTLANMPVVVGPVFWFQLVASQYRPQDPRVLFRIDQYWTKLNKTDQKFTVRENSYRRKIDHQNLKYFMWLGNQPMMFTAVVDSKHIINFPMRTMLVKIIIFGMIRIVQNCSELFSISQGQCIVMKCCFVETPTSLWHCSHVTLGRNRVHYAYQHDNHAC